MNVQQALAKAQKQILTASAKIDAEILLAEVLGQSLTWLKTWPEFELSDEQNHQFESWVALREKGMPIAYIVGYKDFWTLRLTTNNSTLIPRAETELVVELALDFLVDCQKATVLDLGCGTGAIALAIASERLNDEVFGVDVNPAAVELAKLNAKNNDLNQVSFLTSSWFDAVPKKPFDLIVANPPYVAETDPHLSQGDLRYEPDTALIASDNGFADIHTIVARAPEFLKPGGGLMIEHGFEQGPEVVNIFIANGLEQVSCHKDLAGLDRVTIGVLPK